MLGYTALTIPCCLAMVPAVSCVLFNLPYVPSGPWFVNNVLNDADILHVTNQIPDWSFMEHMERSKGKSLAEWALLPGKTRVVVDRGARQETKRAKLILDSESDETMSFQDFINNKDYLVFDADVMHVNEIVRNVTHPRFLMSELCRTLTSNYKNLAIMRLIGAKSSSDRGTFAKSIKDGDHQVLVFVGDATANISIHSPRRHFTNTSFIVSKGSMVYVPSRAAYTITYHGVTSVARFAIVMFKWVRNQARYECEEEPIEDHIPDGPVSEYENGPASPPKNITFIAPFWLINQRVMSPFGLGCSGLGNRTYDAVLTAAAIGYRLFDTAQVYPGEFLEHGKDSRQLGGCYADNNSNTMVFAEQELGRALSHSDDLDRSQIFIISKLLPGCSEPTGIEDSIKASLGRLFTDYLDALLMQFSTRNFQAAALHESCWPNSPNAAYPDASCNHGGWKVWQELEKAVDSGLVESIGVSNIHPHDLRQLLKFALKPISVVKNYFDPFHQDEEVRKICEYHGIVYIGYGTLGYHFMQSAHPDQNAENPVLDDPIIKIAAKEANVTEANLVLRWAMERQYVVMVPSTSNLKQLKLYWEAYRKKMNSWSLNIIDRLDGMVKYENSRFLRDEAVYPRIEKLKNKSEEDEIEQDWQGFSDKDEL